MDMVTLQGPTDRVLDMDPRGMNDLEAGIHFLGTMGQSFPGMTMRQLMSLGATPLAGEKCEWWQMWCKTRNLAGDLYRGGARVVKDVIEGSGKILGSAVRLASDEEVLDAAGRAAAAVATGGGSEGVRGTVDAAFGSEDGKGAELLAAFGRGWKRLFGGQGDAPAYQSRPMTAGSVLPWVVAGGAILFVVAQKPQGRRR